MIGAEQETVRIDGIAEARRFLEPGHARKGSRNALSRILNEDDLCLQI
jgi:hypothetical protein